MMIMTLFRCRIIPISVIFCIFSLTMIITITTPSISIDNKEITINNNHYAYASPSSSPPTSALPYQTAIATLADFNFASAGDWGCTSV